GGCRRGMAKVMNAYDLPARVSFFGREDASHMENIEYRKTAEAIMCNLLTNPPRLHQVEQKHQQPIA
ncbi:hypothetical protein Tco_0366287, partial [Tanacetum coccineum]